MNGQSKALIFSATGSAVKASLAKIISSIYRSMTGTGNVIASTSERGGGQCSKELNRSRIFRWQLEKGIVDSGRYANTSSLRTSTYVKLLSDK